MNQSFRVFRRYDKVAAAGYVRADDIVDAVMESYRRREKSFRMAYTVQRELGMAGQDIADLFPVDQVLAVHQRQSGKICKG